MNFAPTSQSIGDHSNVVSLGVDSVAMGQTGPTNASVSTGWFIEYIEFQWSVTNLVNISLFLDSSIQLIHSGQTFVPPRTVGGNPQRNQVFHQDLKALGQLQNGNWKFRFKVPKAFQRVREGTSWAFVYNNSAVMTDAMQVIYKAKS